MDKKIIVVVKEAYGVRRAFPASIQAARVTGMLNTRTLTARKLRALRTMGFELLISYDHASEATQLHDGILAELE